MKLLLIFLALPACGAVDVKDSSHDVHVHGETETVIRVEIESCDKIKDDELRVRCVEAAIPPFGVNGTAQ